MILLVSGTVLPLLLASLAVAELLERQGRGSVVVLGSVAGDRGRRANYIYGAAKAGLPSEAELRLLKELQIAVNKSTKTINEAANPDKPKLVALGGRQGELRNLLDQLMQKASRGEMKLTLLVPKAKKLTASSAAAVDTMRPVRAKPLVTATGVLAPLSCISLIRLMRKTS